MKKETIVISLGGSLVVPEKIKIGFLKKFKKFILFWVEKGKRFVIVVGGGRVCRDYQRQAKKLGIKDQTSLDIIGISVTHTNAWLIKFLFSSCAFERIITDPTKKIKTNKKIIVAGGYKPGRSTDYVAVLLAKNFGAKTVINASNIDYLYDKDPRKHKDAKKISKTTFARLLKIIGRKWSPGMNVPFDPVAAQLANKEKIRIIILNGKHLKNWDNLFRGKPFKGSVIEPFSS